MENRWRLSAFADEAGNSLEEQIAALKKWNIHAVELRNVNGKNVSDLTQSEAESICRTLAENGIHVSSVGSPIGKIDIREPFEAHFEKFMHVLDVAKWLKTDYIRMFSFFMPEDEDPYQYTDEVLRRLRMNKQAAEEAGKILLHENEKGIFGDNADRSLLIMKELYGDHFAFTFDFSNFVQCHEDTLRAWDMLLPYVRYIHLKDSCYVDEAPQRDDGRQVVGNAHKPLGQGDGQVRTILSKLYERGYDGYLSLEPHLGEEYGMTMAEQFDSAAEAAVKLLGEITGGKIL